VGQGAEAAIAVTATTEEQFAAAMDGYRQACRAKGEEERWFRIGGYAVRLTFAGPSLVDSLSLAFQHLAITPVGRADLHVAFWDSVSTGVPLPPEAGDLEEHALKGMPGTQGDASVLSAYLRPDTGLSMLHLARNEAIYWVPDAKKVPYYDRAGPLRGILSWWMGRNRRQFVHAAALGRAHGGVLLAGRGGSGKSTTALASLVAGIGFLADDYCLLSTEGDRTIYSIYSCAKLNADNLHKVPGLKAAPANGHRLEYEKAVYTLLQDYSSQLLKQFPLKAILLPRVGGGATARLEPISAGRALTALAPSSLLQLSGVTAESLRIFASLVAAVPSYELWLADDPFEAAPLIDDLLGGPS